MKHGNDIHRISFGDPRQLIYFKAFISRLVPSMMPELIFYVVEYGDLSDLEGIRKDANIDTLPPLGKRSSHIFFPAK